MDIANVKLPTNVTKTSFTANWEIPNSALEYLLDVATDKAFTSKLAGYDEAVIIDNYEEITGLSDLTKYYYRVKAIGVYDSGTAEVITGGDLYADGKAWDIDAWIGYKLRLTVDTGTIEEVDIISNTLDTITADFVADPDFITDFEIIQYADWSFAMEVLTGFFIKGLSMEMKTNLSEIFSVSGITFEVKSDTVSQSYIRNLDGESISGVSILISSVDWINKGSWDPIYDEDPESPENGDFYTISGEGENDITGETEEFTIEDILLYDNDEWQIKIKRNIISNDIGIAGYNVDYNTDNLLTIKKDTYQDQLLIVNFIAGSQYIPLTLKKYGNFGNFINNPKPLYKNNKFFI